MSSYMEIWRIILKLKTTKMTESFAQLLEESFKKIETCPGSIVRGMVVSISKDVVLVDAGLKSESSIPIEQFYNSQGKLEVKVGDYVDVTLDAVEDGFGETLLSREKAKRYESWLVLEKAYKETLTVTGMINGKVKGGFTVELNGVRAFLPGSLVDIRPMRDRDTSYLENQTLEFKVIKLDHKRNNVVVSRRAVIESENSAERENLLNQLHESIVVKGIVKNLTDYGAFIDLGGVDGLLHITDMAWKRVKHPSDIVNIGDEISVKVLKFDRERERVSLGLKQLGLDPWISIMKNYKEGDKLIGQVTNLTDYGCFIDIEGGIEGLVHISEMDWTNKNIHPSKAVTVGESIEVMVLDIDEERRRISLGIKQCKINPWKKFESTYNRGDRVMGKIKSITDFGIFIGLEGGIDGLVHLSDVSWYLSDEDAVRDYKKGDEIMAMVLQVDSERERVSLGIKQLTEDILGNYSSVHKKGSIISGKIIAMDDKGITLELLDNNDIIVHGYLRFSEAPDNKYLQQDKYTTNSLNVGNSIRVKLDGVDRKNKVVNVSAYNMHEENEKIKPDIIAHHKKEKSNFVGVMAEAFKAATNKHE